MKATSLLRPVASGHEDFADGPITERRFSHDFGDVESLHSDDFSRDTIPGPPPDSGVEWAPITIPAPPPIAHFDDDER